MHILDYIHTEASFNETFGCLMEHLSLSKALPYLYWAFSAVYSCLRANSSLLSCHSVRTQNLNVIIVHFHCFGVDFYLPLLMKWN